MGVSIYLGYNDKISYIMNDCSMAMTNSKLPV
jgi:hypothetical protein